MGVVLLHENETHILHDSYDLADDHRLLVLSRYAFDPPWVRTDRNVAWWWDAA